jgi:HK97 family phage portal protein
MPLSWRFPFITKAGGSVRATSGPPPGEALSPAYPGGGWLRIFESFPGAWQQNVVLDRETLLTYFAVYACITLIASDLAKLRVKLVEQDDDGIWSETTNPAYSPVLRKPNSYQTRIQFWESYFLSKLTRGNTYVLKLRDARNVVTGLIPLSPDRTIPLIASDGSIFYQCIAPRELGWSEPSVIVPQREIIHDRMNCLYHPLLGTSPIWAAAFAAAQGMAIQSSQAKFFKNASQPGGVLTAPGAISDDTAARVKASWETNFTGDNAGRVAVLGDGLKYERMALTATEAQLIEQLKWTADVVCSVFHVPGYKIGLGAMPTYNNIQALNVEYYSQCLQSLIEAAECCLDEGLECPPTLGTEFDIDNLLRMDSITQMTVLAEGVKGAIVAPNEARSRIDLPPVEGGDSPLAQQQNYSLAALARRDAAQPAPPSTNGGASPPMPVNMETPAGDTEPADAADAAAEAAAGKGFIAAFTAALRKESAHV